MSVIVVESTVENGKITIMRNTRTILLLLSDAREADRNFMFGVTKYANLYTKWIFNRNPPFYRNNLQRYLKDCLKDRLDGLIVSGAFFKDIKQAIPKGIPFIVISHYEVISDYPTVIGNWEKAGEMGAEHLLERGINNFAFCGFETLCWSKGRLSGFKKRLAKEGCNTNVMDLNPVRKINVIEKERSSIAEWLVKLPKPIGIMGGNDECAQEVLEMCKVQEINVPDEVAIIGADNDRLICKLCSPPLSSIAHSDEHAGYETAELLDRMISGKEKLTTQRIVVQPSHIVMRQSTDMIAVEDADIAEAIRYIRDKATQPIQVEDVVEAVGISRRVLQQRFKKELRHSISDELCHARCNNVVRLLLETNLSVSQISDKLGFSGEQNLARLFRRVKKISPIEFRRLHR